MTFMAAAKKITPGSPNFFYKDLVQVGIDASGVIIDHKTKRPMSLTVGLIESTGWVVYA